MAKRIGYNIPVTLLRGGIIPPEKMTLAEAVREVMHSPIRDSLVEARIICEDLLIEGLLHIEAIYNLPDFPRTPPADTADAGEVAAKTAGGTADAAK